MSVAGQDRLVRVARAMQSGVRWLKEQAPHLEDPRACAAAIRALVSAERNTHSQLIQRLVRSISAKQLPSGSWNDELWDTSWVVASLLDSGVSPSAAPIQKAIRFLKATQDPVDGTWYEEPFETMLVLEILAQCEPEFLRTAGEPALKWIASLQRDDGLIVGTRYTGMAVSLFRRIETTEWQTRVVRLGLGALTNSIQERSIWTSAAWSNFYALQALLDCGFTVTDPAAIKAIDWYLNNQEAIGRWFQVSEVHDSSMAILVLSRLLTVPLVDVPEPQVAVLHVSRENGTLRVRFVPPGVGAIVPSERMKLSERVRTELADTQRQMLAAIGRTRTRASHAELAGSDAAGTDEGVLLRAGQYAYGHLIPPRIQAMLEVSSADHLLLDVDERLIDLPWELTHDGQDFACIRYAAGRRLVSEQVSVVGSKTPRSVRQGSALVVADPTGDLPAAAREGERIASVLRENGLRVVMMSGREADKQTFLLALSQFDILHFAGHATHDSVSPDESCLVLGDGEVSAFEIARFLKHPCPSVVFLNACWSAEELPDPDAYSPMMRGLGRTFMYSGVPAFVGYLVPVPDRTATNFAIEFYSSLVKGFSIGEAVRRSRLRVRGNSGDLTWASAVLYGEPSMGVFEPALRG